jgi:hypothetical protein
MNEPHDEPAPVDERREPMTFPDVVRVVFTGRSGFAAFAAERLVRAAPPSFFIVAWLLGMDGVAGALELEYVTRGEHLVDNWFHAWLRIMFAGIGAGVVRYWLAGTLFHGVVLLAGGRGAARTSRYIFLYAALPVVVIELSVKVVQMLAYGNDYFAGQTNPTLDGVNGGLMAGAFVYSALLCYTGMRRVQGADRTRSILVLVAVAIAAAMFALAIFMQGGG